MIMIGLGYLCLNRSRHSLGRRVPTGRLAGQIGSSLMGLPTLSTSLPSVYGAENARIISAGQLRDQGNTVITIEHDLDIIEKADHIIEMGPGAETAAEVVACGTVDEIRETISP